MNLQTKTALAKKAIDSIVTHDDTLMEAVEMGAAALHKHIDDGIAAAKKRRAAAAGVILGEEAAQATE